MYDIYLYLYIYVYMYIYIYIYIIYTNTGKSGKGGNIQRQIHHPSFANVNFKEAEARLEGKIGEVLFRPSSKVTYIYVCM
jgi:hypothetical protein